MPHVVVLPGDGIGPEVAAPAVAILQQLAPDVTIEEQLFGGASIDANGTALTDASPLKREVIEGTDLLVVRELTGGIYFGEKTRTEDSASDLCAYTVTEIERIARTAFGAARAKVTSVDKANVLETSRLWREVVSALHSREFPHIQLEHVLVDNAAMQLVSAPRHFDTILTENMFGDILSDEAAMLT